MNIFNTVYLILASSPGRQLKFRKKDGLVAIATMLVRMRWPYETVLPPASLSVQGSVGSHTEENRPTLHEILPLLRAERFTERITS